MVGSVRPWSHAKNTIPSATSNFISHVTRFQEKTERILATENLSKDFQQIGMSEILISQVFSQSAINA